MKFNLILIAFLLISCSNGSLNNTKNSLPYTSKGFALIYNQTDFEEKLISSKLNPQNIEIGHNILKKNTYVVITNPMNKKSLTLKVTKKVKYPDFFKVLITENVAKKLDLNTKMPYVEIEQRIKNKSFIGEDNLILLFKINESANLLVKYFDIKNEFLGEYNLGNIF